MSYVLKKGKFRAFTLVRINCSISSFIYMLQTGSESSVERLMKQITSFMSEISDEFKVVVVRAISALCQKYPHKHSVMMNHLSSMLRDEVRYPS